MSVNVNNQNQRVGLVHKPGFPPAKGDVVQCLLSGADVPAETYLLLQKRMDSKTPTEFQYDDISFTGIVRQATRGPSAGTMGPDLKMNSHEEVFLRIEPLS